MISATKISIIFQPNDPSFLDKFQIFFTTYNPPNLIIKINPKQSKPEIKGAHNQLKMIPNKLFIFKPYPPFPRDTPVIAPIKAALIEIGRAGKNPFRKENNKSVKAPEKATIKLSTDERGKSLELTILIT